MDKLSDDNLVYSNENSQYKKVGKIVSNLFSNMALVSLNLKYLNSPLYNFIDGQYIKVKQNISTWWPRK